MVKGQVIGLVHSNLLCSLSDCCLQNWLCFSFIFTLMCSQKDRSVCWTCLRCWPCRAKAAVTQKTLQLMFYWNFFNAQAVNSVLKLMQGMRQCCCSGRKQVYKSFTTAILQGAKRCKVVYFVLIKLFFFFMCCLTQGAHMYLQTYQNTTRNWQIAFILCSTSNAIILIHIYCITKKS